MEIEGLNQAELFNSACIFIKYNCSLIPSPRGGRLG